MGRIWVFRMGLRDGGNPQGVCPVLLGDPAGTVAALQSRLANTPPNDVSYQGSIPYLLNELQQGRLRQGWGTIDPDLDLKNGKVGFAENFVLACQKYWGSSPSDIEAGLRSGCGRYNILRLMLDMQSGDTVFIPRVPDYYHFTVAAVSRPYYFDTQIGMPNPLDFRVDYRHVIEVEDSRAYPYGQATLPAVVFQPYRKAVNEVKPHHRAYPGISHFLLTQ